jgi:hypothetical protein
MVSPSLRNSTAIDAHFLSLDNNTRKTISKEQLYCFISPHPPSTNTLAR